MMTRLSIPLLVFVCLLAASGWQANAQQAGEVAIPSGQNDAQKADSKAKKMDGINLDDLCQKWFHAPEEQKSDQEKVYRTGETRFPPSRFRMQYVFHKNGECQWYYLSPDDQHRLKPGRWRLDGQTLLIDKQEADKGAEKETFKIITLTHDTLRLKPIERGETKR